MRFELNISQHRQLLIAGKSLLLISEQWHISAQTSRKTVTGYHFEVLIFSQIKLIHIPCSSVFVYFCLSPSRLLPRRVHITVIGVRSCFPFIGLCDDSWFVQMRRGRNGGSRKCIFNSFFSTYGCLVYWGRPFTTSPCSFLVGVKRKGSYPGSYE